MRSASASVKRDLRQEVTDSIVAALEKGVAPWQRPWQSGVFEMPMNPTSGKPYRGGNAVHLMVVGMRNGYESCRSRHNSYNADALIVPTRFAFYSMRNRQSHSASVLTFPR